MTILHTAGAWQQAMRCVSQAFLIVHDRDTLDFVGNRTDCALLVLLRSWGLSYAALREARLAVCGSCQEAFYHADAANAHRFLRVSNDAMREPALPVSITRPVSRVPSLVAVEPLWSRPCLSGDINANYILLQARHDDLEELYAFSWERKMASVLLREPDSLLLYNKARRARVTIPLSLHACACYVSIPRLCLVCLLHAMPSALCNRAYTEKLARIVLARSTMS